MQQAARLENDVYKLSFKVKLNVLTVSQLGGCGKPKKWRRSTQG